MCKIWEKLRVVVVLTGPVGLVMDILRVWNRLCKIKHGSSPRYDNSQIDSTSFVHALVYVSLFYMENNYQNFQFYLWHIGWFSQLGFSLFLATKEWIWCFNPRNLQAIRYLVTPFVETGYFPLSLTMFERKCSATNMFLSLDLLIRKVREVASCLVRSQPTAIRILT